jgi:hypothetical protein
MFQLLVGAFYFNSNSYNPSSISAVSTFVSSQTNFLSLRQQATGKREQQYNTLAKMFGF